MVIGYLPHAPLRSQKTDRRPVYETGSLTIESFAVFWLIITHTALQYTENPS